MYTWWLYVASVHTCSKRYTLVPLSELACVVEHHVNSELAQLSGTDSTVGSTGGSVVKELM